MVQQSRIENTIINSLFFNEEYTRKVLPFIKEEYFGNRVEQLLFGEIFKFIEKYNNLPTKDAMLIELGNRKDINEEELNHLKDFPSYRFEGYYIFPSNAYNNLKHNPYHLIYFLQIYYNPDHHIHFLI